MENFKKKLQQYNKEISHEGIMMKVLWKHRSKQQEMRVLRSAISADMTEHNDIICCDKNGVYNDPYGNVYKFNMKEKPEDIDEVHLSINYADVDPKWFDSLYKKYEDKIWRKVPREPEGDHYKRWYFHCYLCHRYLTSFLKLRNHLNHHYKFHPYKCLICETRYTSIYAYERHKKTHEVSMDNQ